MLPTQTTSAETADIWVTVDWAAKPPEGQTGVAHFVGVIVNAGANQPTRVHQRAPRAVGVPRVLSRRRDLRRIAIDAAPHQGSVWTNRVSTRLQRRPVPVGIPAHRDRGCQDGGMRRRPVLLIGAAYVVVLFLLVFTPISWTLNRLTVEMYVAWKYDLGWPGDFLPEDFGAALNVLLFLPLGILVVALFRWPWWLATAVAVTVSMSIELVQAVVPALHRQASLSDVVTNGLGGLLGALVATAWNRRHELRQLAPLAASQARDAAKPRDRDP